MPVKIKPLTKRQIREVSESYSDVFPHWDREDGGAVFSRTCGPVKQQVWFEGLRSGEYRPTSGVRILVAPDVAMLHQLLDIRNRQVLLREHEAKRPLIIEAMLTQFRPYINRPLDPADVLSLCEAQATDRISDVCGVAALAAFLGKTVSALEWCKKADQYLASIGRKPAEWELSYHSFLKRLSDALESNGEAAFFENIRRG